MDDEDEEEFESDEPAAEESSHVADEDLAAEDDASHEVDWIKAESEAGINESQQSARPPALGRSATEPSTSYANMPRRATFPNLPGFAVPAAPVVPAAPAPVLDDKGIQPEPPKRKVNGEGTDSESRSSSRIGKRRKYSTEPADSVNPVSTDTMAPPKLLSQSLHLNGMIFYPDAIAEATENFRSLSRAFLNEQASRKDTFEAALRRANRRANDAEHRLQDMSQSYADKLKAKDEAHASAFESLRMENATLTASMVALRESMQALSESSSRRAVLEDKHAKLARLEKLGPRLTAEAAKLLQVRTQASSRAAAIVVQHEKLSSLIHDFVYDIEEVSMKRLKRYGVEIQDGSRAVGERILEAKGDWEELSELAQMFWSGFNGLVGGSEGDGNEESQRYGEGKNVESNNEGREERNVERNEKENEAEGVKHGTGGQNTQGEGKENEGTRKENEVKETKEGRGQSEEGRKQRAERQVENEGRKANVDEQEKGKEGDQPQVEENQVAEIEKVQNGRNSEEKSTEGAPITAASEPKQMDVEMEIDRLRTEPEKQRSDKETTL